MLTHLTASLGPIQMSEIGSSPTLLLVSFSFSFLNCEIHILQVHQLVQVVQKCQRQSTVAESGADGISSQDLQASSNM